MLAHFRDCYPMGSVITDLVKVEEGIFLVKAQIMVNSTILGTAIAGSATIEEAEDLALKRALIHAGFSGAKPTPSVTPTAYTPLAPLPDPSRNGNSYPDPLPIWSPPAAATPPIPPPETYAKPVEVPDPLDSEDVSDIIAQSSVELERIGWSAKEGREYLRSRFRKDSRSQLDRTELKEFLRHLKQQPTRMAKESPF